MTFPDTYTTLKDLSPSQDLTTFSAVLILALKERCETTEVQELLERMCQLLDPYASLPDFPKSGIVVRNYIHRLQKKFFA